MLKRSSVILEITPTRLELTVVRGGVAGEVRVERYNPPEPDADWANVLRDRHATLSAWVTELAVQNWSTTITFRSATTSCSLFSCPASAGPAALDNAARMALGEIAGYPINEHPVDTQALGADPRPIVKPNPGGQGAAAAGQRMAHALAAVDQEQFTQLLAQWTASCGLSVGRLVPTIAAPILNTFNQLMSRNASETPGAVLWLGEHESFLAVGDGAGLRLFRSMALGVESLVEALQRPIQPRTEGSEPVSIDRAAARSLLEKFGVPQAADLLDARLDLSGQSVIPLLSPVLQRAAVELKQSLRFGLVEKDRASVQIRIVGPGASLPRLADVLSQLCGLPITSDSSPIANPTSSATGNIAALIRATSLELTLLPASMQQTRMVAKARRGLWVGIAASVALVGFYTGWTYFALYAAQRQIESLTAQASEAQRLDGERKSLVATQFAARAASAQINDSLGATPNWSAVLSALAGQTPLHTQVRAIDMADGDDGPTARVSCTMLAGDDAAFAAQLQAYIEGLTSLPVISAVKMGGTTRSRGELSDEFSFDLMISLVPIPYAHLAPEAFKNTAPGHARDAGQPNGNRQAGVPTGGANP